MKVIFACGGTAGHINPAIAVADTLKKREPSVEILFVGNPNRMEAQLVPNAGYDFKPVVIEGFRRSITPKNITYNFKSVFYMISSGSKVKKILEEFKPDVVLGTGGYVSGPVLRIASKMKINTLTHESNAYPGVTTKLLTHYVDQVLLAVSSAKKYLPEGKKYVVTGNPVRPEILNADRNKSRDALGVKNKVCILSYGGSNGADKINKSVAELIGRLQPEKKTHHIHATGRFGIATFPKLLKTFGIDSHDEHLDIREYIENMDECLAAADLVICRAGAMTISEIQAVGKPSILIPSPNVAENHQYHNAMVLVNRNAAILIEEKDLTGQHLYTVVSELLNDKRELKNIGINAKNMGVLDGADKICDNILNIYNA